VSVQAVALLSGGLDSSLAIRLMLDQGIEVEALHFVSVFNGTAPESPSVLRPLRVARELGVPLRPINFTREQLGIVCDPAHGYGSHMNPCIDCHIAMLRRAAERMQATGARFIVTGEVMGQRPMSQRSHVLSQIDNETALGGLILRPLSAKLLPPTVPEREGWVDRERLLDIHGRSRKPQLALARHYGLAEHGSPAGGCLLTDPGFSARLADLLGHSPARVPDLNEVHLLKVGRHFRLDDATRLVIGRDHRENVTIFTFSRPTDLLLTTRDAPGPTALLRGNLGDEHVRVAAALTARYSKLRQAPSVAIEMRPGRSGPASPARGVEVSPSTEVAAARIGAAEGS